MRKKILAANWKMNLGLKESLKLAKNIQKKLKISYKKHFILFPSVHAIFYLKNFLEAKNISIGAQDCSQFEHGAFTGDISAKMIKELGCNYLILGHSERRVIYNENHSILKSKLYLAAKHKIKVVFCIGENENEYLRKKSKIVISRQLRKVFPTNFNFANLIIAYEPVWAIGTNKVPQLYEINDMHKYIKNIIYKLYSIKNISVIYGGSLNAKNCKNIFTLENVDGGLVGGASLNSSEFKFIYDTLN